MGRTSTLGFQATILVVYRIDRHGSFSVRGRQRRVSDVPTIKYSTRNGGQASAVALSFGGQVALPTLQNYRHASLVELWIGNPARFALP